MSASKRAAEELAKGYRAGRIAVLLNVRPVPSAELQSIGFIVLDEFDSALDEQRKIWCLICMHAN